MDIRGGAEVFGSEIRGILHEDPKQGPCIESIKGMEAMMKPLSESMRARLDRAIDDISALIDSEEFANDECDRIFGLLEGARELLIMALGINDEWRRP